MCREQRRATSEPKACSCLLLQYEQLYNEAKGERCSTVFKTKQATGAHTKTEAAFGAREQKPLMHKNARLVIQRLDSLKRQRSLELPRRLVHSFGIRIAW